MRIPCIISNYPLFWIWLLQSCFIVLLATLNPNHYTTIDSQYYLESAHNLLSGKGYTIFQNKQYIWNSIFPPGYPLAIALVSFLTKTHVLVASKLVNAMASAIWIICLKQWFGYKNAVWIAPVLLTGPFLKLWAHSWSEPLFLLILFCWTYHFSRLEESKNLSILNMTSFFMLGLLLIVTRYAGIFITPLTFMYGLKAVVKNDRSKALPYIRLASGWTLSFGGYLWTNLNWSGAWFGGNRFGANIRITDQLHLFSKGLLNELLVRDTDFSTIDTLFCVSLVIQVVLLFLIRQQLPDHPDGHGKPTLITAYFSITAIFYLFFLFSLRIFSPFDEPGYRLLAPFSFLMLISILFPIPAQKIPNRLKYLLMMLIMLSWIDLIPQQDYKIRVLATVIRSAIPAF